MNNEAQLPKTQAATLAEVRRINASDEPAIQRGTQRKGLNVAAIEALIRKGYLRSLTVNLPPTPGGDGSPRSIAYILEA